MRATEIIDYLYKQAGVGWDVHGYKAEDLDQFYADQKAIEGAEEDADKYMDSQGIKTVPYNEMFPKKPEKPTMKHVSGIGGTFYGPFLGAMLGATPGAMIEKPKVMGIGAAIGGGLGLAGVGALEGKHLLDYHKGMREYKHDLSTYDDRVANADSARKRNGEYWKAYEGYLHSKYTPQQVDMIMEGTDIPRWSGVEVEAPTKKPTNYKANDYLMGNYGDQGYYGYLTDEVYNDEPSIRNLSQEEIDAFRAQYLDAIEEAKKSGYWDQDKYLRDGAEAFLEKLDALKEHGADTYRLEWE